MSLFAMMHVNQIPTKVQMEQMRELVRGNCFPLNETTYINDFDAKIKKPHVHKVDCCHSVSNKWFCCDCGVEVKLSKDKTKWETA